MHPATSITVIGNIPEQPNYAEFTRPETDYEVPFCECKSDTGVKCLLCCNRKFSVESFVILVL